jgi:Protein of unknown function (DUF664)
MNETSLKADLQRYLQDARDALVWKLDGLSEYDKRRPLVPTGTNLLGLIKHAALVETGYLGEIFGRPYGGWMPAGSTDEEPNADMWASADETSGQIVDYYRSVWTHSDATLESLPLDAVGTVPWWPEDRRQTTLGHLTIRVIGDTSRHAGHADIVRELIDGTAGWLPRSDNLPEANEEWWSTYRQRLDEVALSFRTEA